MTTARSLWWGAFAVALVLAWPALQGQFLSDDVGVMHWLVRWDQGAGLWSTILSKFSHGLDVPSHYYRPLAFLTFGLDQRLFGWSPLAWHLTGYAIHVLNAVLVGALMRALGGDALRASTAAGLFLLFPLAPEVSIWLSGRYDVLAVTGMLVAVYAHLRAQGFDRWRVLSLFGFALGLAAKEAAMPTPGLLVLASLLRAAGGETLWARCWRTARDCLPAVLLFFAYLGLRHAIFGSALQVYPGSDPGATVGLADLLARIAALGSIPRIVFVDAVLLGSLALLATVFGLIAAALVARREQRLLAGWALPFAWTVLSLASLLPHLQSVYAHGEGGRFYYATAAWLALTIAPAIGLVRERAPEVLAALLLATYGGAQAHALAQWARAGAAMHALLPALAAQAATLGDDDFALVLVPDHIGPVPFARNAQAGLVLPPLQREPLLAKLVPILPQAIATWPQRIADGDVAKIKQREIAPRLDAVFCFDAAASRLIRLEPTPDWRDAAAFTAALAAHGREACALD